MIVGVGVEWLDVPRFEAAERRYGRRLNERLFTEGERAFAAGADIGEMVDSIFADQARQISDLAESHESRGEEAMADLLRVVRDEHLPEIRKEYDEPSPD